MRFKLHGLDQAGFDRWVSDVKNGQGALTAEKYVDMVKPSVADPDHPFRVGLARDLFDRVAQPLRGAGQAVRDRMSWMQDGHMDGHMGHGGMTPVARRPLPITGSKPTPALQKPAEDKGSGPNVTAPADPNAAPGQLKPGDPNNNGM